MKLDQILETKHLILRILQPSDILDMEKMHADPDVMHMSGAGKPLSKEDNQKYCRMLLDHWKDKGYGMYVLEEKETNDFCGLAGLRSLNDYPAPELGWILPKSKWGKAYAIEACRAIKDHAFQKLGVQELYHFIDPANVRSIRLAEKLGAIPFKEIRDDTNRVTDILYVSRP